MIIKGAGGFGDSCYLYPVAEYYIRNFPNDDIYISTSYGDLFSNLRCKCKPFSRREPASVECTYMPCRDNLTTNQYEDTCIQAKLPFIPPFEIKMDFNENDKIKLNTDKKICVVRSSYLRKDKFGNPHNTDIMIDNSIIEKMIEKNKDKYYFVGIGSTGEPNNIVGLDVDLTGQTTIKQLFWLVKQSDMCITQCGHLLPIAESLNKKVFVIFNPKIKTTSNTISRTATPDKVITKGSTEWCWMDDKDILEKFDYYTKIEPFKNQVTNLQLSNEIRDKRVVILGTAPSALENRGYRINEFETIIRVNNYDLKKYSDKIGNRTDIYFSFFGSSIHKTTEELQSEKVKMLWSKLPYCDFTNYYKFGDDERRGVLNFKKYYENFKIKNIPIYIPKLKHLVSETEKIGRMMSSGVSCIYNTLTLKPKRLYITGFDFFGSGIHNYDQPWRNGAGGHLTNVEREFVKKLYLENKDIIVLDNKLKKIFGVENEVV